MKLKPTDIARLEAELKRVNENSREHTFNSASEISLVLASLDGRLEDLGVTGKAMEGAQFEMVSGKAVSENYKFARRATRVCAQRYPTGWFITCIEAAKIPYQGGSQTFLLTPPQDLLAVAAFRIRSYRTIS